MQDHTTSRNINRGLGNIREYKSSHGAIGFSINSIDELIRARNTSPTLREVIDVYSYDIWKSLMTQEHFERAAAVNFVPFIDKWLELRDVPTVKKLFPLRALYAAIEKERWEFCRTLMEEAGLPAGIELHIAVVVEKVAFAARLIDEGVKDIVIDDGLVQDDIGVYEMTKDHSHLRVIEEKDLLLMWSEGGERYHGNVKACGHILNYRRSTVVEIACYTQNIEMLRMLMSKGYSLHYTLERFYEVEELYPSEDPMYKAFDHLDKLLRFLYPLLGEVIAESTLEYARRLVDDRSQFALRRPSDLVTRLVKSMPEITQFNVDDAVMFTHASVMHRPIIFIANIVAFGNVAYMPLALSVLLRQEGSLEELISGHEDVNTVKRLIEYYDEHKAKIPHARPGFAPIFDIMKQRDQ